MLAGQVICRFTAPVVVYKGFFFNQMITSAIMTIHLVVLCSKETISVTDFSHLSIKNTEHSLVPASVLGGFAAFICFVSLLIQYL